jgi:hypothetical protein
MEPQQTEDGPRSNVPGEGTLVVGSAHLPPELRDMILDQLPIRELLILARKSPTGHQLATKRIYKHVDISFHHTYEHPKIKDIPDTDKDTSVYGNIFIDPNYRPDRKFLPIYRAHTNRQGLLCQKLIRSLTWTSLALNRNFENAVMRRMTNLETVDFCTAARATNGRPDGVLPSLESVTHVEFAGYGTRGLLGRFQSPSLSFKGINLDKLVTLHIDDRIFLCQISQFGRSGKHFPNLKHLSIRSFTIWYADRFPSLFNNVSAQSRDRYRSYGIIMNSARSSLESLEFDLVNQKNGSTRQRRELAKGYHRWFRECIAPTLVKGAWPVLKLVTFPGIRAMECLGEELRATFGDELVGNVFSHEMMALYMKSLSE